MSKKRVLFLSSWFPSRVFPTLGNFNEKFAEAAARHHYVFSVHVRAEAGLNKKLDITKTTENGVYKLHYYFPKKEKEHSGDKIIKSLRYFKYYKKAFYEAVKDNGFPDVIHLNVIWPVGLFALYLNKKYKIPYAVSENNTAYMPYRDIQLGSFEKLLTKKITAAASLMMPVAEDLKKALQAKGLGKKFEVMPNVINFKHFYPPKEKTQREKKRMLHISTLDDDQKNISGMLRTAARLKKDGYDFEFRIIGDGDSSPHEQLARELDLTETVTFKGEITTEEVGEEMRNADFYVMFSNYETFSIVIAEAWGCGIPVVYSQCGGLTEIDEPDYGIRIERRNEDELYKACVHMLKKSDRYDPDKLHDFAESNFSYEAVGKKLSTVYERISAEKKPK